MLECYMNNFMIDRPWRRAGLVIIGLNCDSAESSH